MKKIKKTFRVFESADDDIVTKLSEYAPLPDSKTAQKIFKKSMDNYTETNLHSSPALSPENNVTVEKNTGKLLRKLLPVTAVAFAAVIVFAVVLPAIGDRNTAPTNSYNTAKKVVNGRELKRAVPPDRASKEDIFWLMMNSIYYYDSVSGIVYYNTNMSNDNEMDTDMKKAEFQSCISDSISYMKKETAQISFDVTQENDELSIIDSIDKQTDTDVVLRFCDSKNAINCEYEPDTNTISNDTTELVSLDDIKQAADEERIKYDSDGNISPETLYPDPTNLDIERDILFPQHTALYLMTDYEKWYSDGIISIDGRESYHITVTIDESNELSPYVSIMELWVDVRTGVILKEEFYNKNNKLLAFIFTRDMQFDDEAKPVTPIPDGIKSEIDAIVFEEDERRRIEEQNRLESEVSSLESDAKDTANEYADSIKEDIFYSMLYSIWSYDKISGTVYYPSPSKELSEIYGEHFQSDLIKSTSYCQAYSIPLTGNSIEEIRSQCRITPYMKAEQEKYSNGTKTIEHQSISGNYLYSGSSVNRDGLTGKGINIVPFDERMTVNTSNDTRKIITFPDGTNTITANVSIFPQYKAAMCLSHFDRWEYNNTVTLDGRECFNVSGYIGSEQVRQEIGNKNVTYSPEKAVRFEMWVDTQTGIIVKYLAYDSDDNICDFIFTEDIRFDDNAEPVLPVPENAEKQAMNNKENYSSRENSNDELLIE